MCDVLHVFAPPSDLFYSPPFDVSFYRSHLLCSPNFASFLPFVAQINLWVTWQVLLQCLGKGSQKYVRASAGCTHAIRLLPPPIGVATEYNDNYYFGGLKHLFNRKSAHQHSARISMLCVVQLVHHHQPGFCLFLDTLPSGAPKALLIANITPGTDHDPDQTDQL